MVQTPSNMIPLGTEAPDFSLPDTMSGTAKTLAELKSDTATLVMFICNHCPFVIHIRDELVRLANDYIPRGVAFAAVSSNDAQDYPEDAPEKMKQVAEQCGFPFAYLYDESQEVAKAYDAACTPDFYLYDGDMKLVYRGQLDDARPGNSVPVSGKDLRAALDCIISGEPVNSSQTPSVGCNIKWKT